MSLHRSSGKSGIRAGAGPLVVAALLLSTRTARADDPPAEATESRAQAQDQEARRLSDEGLKHFRVGEYELAIQHFKAAYLRTGVPGLLYNLAQAHRLNGNCVEALALYRRYLAVRPPEVLKGRAEARVAELAECAAGKMSEPAAGATAPTALTLVQPREPAAPAVLVEMRPGGTAGEGPRLSRTGLALVATSAVLLSLAVYCAWQTAEHADRVSAFYQPGGEWTPQAEALESDGQRYRAAAVLSGAGSLVTGGLGGWLVARPRRGR
jgi:hypothetical protein